MSVPLGKAGDVRALLLHRKATLFTRGGVKGLKRSGNAELDKLAVLLLA